jgi:excisionase family DNA binding protein
MTSPSEYHDESFVTVKEAAKWLRVTDERVRDWIRSGRLRAFRSGKDTGRFLIRCKWVREFVDKMSEEMNING